MNRIRPLQTRTFPNIGASQAKALPMQSSTLPAQTDTGLDITALLNLMITMMIMVMMMKMMAGVMKEMT